MAFWAARELLGFDFETTGVDRFHDVPVSYALVTVIGGEVVRSSAGLIDPGRDIPSGATEIHGITTEQARSEGMSLKDAMEMVADALLSASRRGVPVAGMKLDYDLTMLETQTHRLCGAGLQQRGWTGPVLDAVVLDRHLDRFRKGSRTLSALCEHYGVAIDHAHDAAADATASIHVLLALAARYRELRHTELAYLHEAQVGWHQEWAKSYDEWRAGRGMPPIDPSDYEWPVAAEVRSAA